MEIFQDVCENCRGLWQFQNEILKKIFMYTKQCIQSMSKSQHLSTEINSVNMKQLFSNVPCSYMCNKNYFPRDNYKKAYWQKKSATEKTLLVRRGCGLVSATISVQRVKCFFTCSHKQHAFSEAAFRATPLYILPWILIGVGRAWISKLKGLRAELKVF